MNKIRLGFCDMWEGFSKENNWFTNTLRQWFDIEIAEDPDFLIFGQPGKEHRRYKCVKIYFGVESFDPDWRICDYALTCNYIDDDRHYRLPLYVLYTSAEKLMRAREHLPAEIPSRFCSFVVSNAGKKKTQRRVDFFHALSRYKLVDSGGRCLNNIGSPIPGGSAGKIKFLSRYKFNIAFENESKPGYTTEKIVEAFLAGAVPIYWGSPRVIEEFNDKAFVNAHAFVNDYEMIEYIKHLDSNDIRYFQIKQQAVLPAANKYPLCDEEGLRDFFFRIFSVSPQRDRQTWPVWQSLLRIPLGRGKSIKR
jgi:hypothetical protein